MLTDGKTILMHSGDRGNFAIMREAIAAGADLNLQDSSGATALMWASYRGYVDGVKILLQTKRVDLNLRNRGGYTALMLAKFNNHSQIVELLKAAAKE